MPADPSKAIRRVGAALVARHEEIAQAMVARILSDVPSYRRAGRPVADEVLALATATAEILGHAFATGTPIAREDVPIVREHAALRLDRGIDLEAFLHAYRAALFHYWDACAEEAARLRISRADGLALARFALDAIDTITTHAAEAYLREETRRATESGRAARDLVERLIAGQPVGLDRRHPAAPGLDPTAPLILVLARGDGAAARDRLEEALGFGKARPVATIRQGEVVLLTAGADTSEVTSRLRRALGDDDLRCGVSATPAGFPGVARAYREATLTLSYTSVERPVLALAELSAFEAALTGADAATRALIAGKGASLAALPDAEREQATATIRAFAAADMNISAAAATLFVHPNTIRYRLSPIATTSGHDPRTFAGLTDLICILQTAPSA
ncbi:PucR family transcriptional regulator [Conexibacter woesei]|uniref:PucR family transcriptional regulator n=1 Tax=Conexibacter woesei TaxID=191495 RepID=UPI00040C5426|nr:helix-turn-helix domain-containing protein [Conexibacter woesei]